MLPRRQRVQLEEGRAGIEQPLDALAGKQLPAGGVPLDRLRRALGGDLAGALAELGHERLHPRAVGGVLGGGAVGAGLENCHYERLGWRLVMGIAYARIGT